MNKWLNPPPKKPKMENEFPPQDAVPYPPTTTFGTMKKQLRKKKPSKKSKKERIADKSVSLAERLNDKMINS